MVVYSFVPAHTSSYFPLTVDSDGNPIAPPGTASQQGYGKVFIDGGNHTVTYMTPPNRGDGPFVFPYNSCVIKTMACHRHRPIRLTLHHERSRYRRRSDLHRWGTLFVILRVASRRRSTPAGDVVYVQRNGAT